MLTNEQAEFLMAKVKDLPQYAFLNSKNKFFDACVKMIDVLNIIYEYTQEEDLGIMMKELNNLKIRVEQLEKKLNQTTKE